jgi:hypothetical protein
MSMGRSIYRGLEAALQHPFDVIDHSARWRADFVGWADPYATKSRAATAWPPKGDCPL